MNQYDVYLADLNPTIGREQQGTRPVLVISNSYENLLDIVTIIPITSLENRYTRQEIINILCRRFEEMD